MLAIAALCRSTHVQRISGLSGRPWDGIGKRSCDLTAGIWGSTDYVIPQQGKIGVLDRAAAKNLPTSNFTGDADLFLRVARQVLRRSRLQTLSGTGHQNRGRMGSRNFAWAVDDDQWMRRECAGMQVIRCLKDRLTDVYNYWRNNVRHNRVGKISNSDHVHLERTTLVT